MSIDYREIALEKYLQEFAFLVMRQSYYNPIERRDPECTQFAIDLFNYHPCDALSEDVTLTEIEEKYTTIFYNANHSLLSATILRQRAHILENILYLHNPEIDRALIITDTKQISKFEPHLRCNISCGFNDIALLPSNTQIELQRTNDKMKSSSDIDVETLPRAIHQTHIEGLFASMQPSIILLQAIFAYAEFIKAYMHTLPPNKVAKYESALNTSIPTQIGIYLSYFEANLDLAITVIKQAENPIPLGLLKSGQAPKPIIN